MCPQIQLKEASLEAYEDGHLNWIAGGWEWSGWFHCFGLGVGLLLNLDGWTLAPLSGRMAIFVSGWA